MNIGVVIPQVEEVPAPRTLPAIPDHAPRPQRREAPAPQRREPERVPA